jgi:transcriptional regulator with GAF, ATPase, and Fis domain
MSYADRMQRSISVIADEFLQALTRHSWPGTVRELKNFIERSVILSTGAILNGSVPEPTSAPKSAAQVTLEEAERSHILETLLRTEGVVGGPNGAATRLGLKRTTLISMIRRLGINPGRSFAMPARSPVISFGG